MFDNLNGSHVLLIVIFLVVIPFVVAWFTAKYAASKGYSWHLFFWLGFLVNWFVMLIVALAVPRKLFAPNPKP